MSNEFALTILTTSSCNARCPYCFEKGIKHSTLSIEKADKVIGFILNNYHNKPLHISWFGGEPLLEKNAICKLSEQFIRICKARCIPYTAQIVTNGFCLNDIKINHNIIFIAIR